jgi:hypothetical protein
MARTADDIVVPSGGDVYQAPVGTALPADLTTPLPVAWENIGFLSDDNPPTITGLTRDATDLFAWNVDTALRSALAPSAPLIQMELLQVESEDAFKLFFGGGTWVAGVDPAASSYEAPGISVPVEAATVIDVVDGAKLYRLMFPRTQTRANGDMAMGRGAFITMPIAMSVLTPSSGTWLKALVGPNPVVTFEATATEAEGEPEAEEPEARSSKRTAA